MICDTPGNRGYVHITDGTRSLTLTTGSALPVDGSSVTQPISAATLPLPTGAVALADLFKSRSDTYTSIASGTTITATTAPLRSFALQVVGTGGGAASWDVRLEGSLDGVTFSQILQHTTVTLDGESLYTGSAFFPALYFRSRCAGLALGLASNIVVTIIGMA